MDKTNLAPTYLTAGIVAGPFFIGVDLIQAFTREGFNWIRHPASLLSLGDLGWIQIANFVLTGIFFILCGIGLREVYMRALAANGCPVCLSSLVSRLSWAVYSPQILV